MQLGGPPALPSCGQWPAAWPACPPCGSQAPSSTAGDRGAPARREGVDRREGVVLVVPQQPPSCARRHPGRHHGSGGCKTGTAPLSLTRAWSRAPALSGERPRHRPPAPPARDCSCGCRSRCWGQRRCAGRAPPPACCRWRGCCPRCWPACAAPAPRRWSLAWAGRRWASSPPPPRWRWAGRPAAARTPPWRWGAPQGPPGRGGWMGAGGRSRAPSHAWEERWACTARGGCARHCAVPGRHACLHAGLHHLHRLCRALARHLGQAQAPAQWHFLGADLLWWGGGGRAAPRVCAALRCTRGRGRRDPSRQACRARAGRAAAAAPRARTQSTTPSE